MVCPATVSSAASTPTTESRIALDARGRVREVVVSEADPSGAAERLAALIGDLVATRLTPVGLDLRAVGRGYVAIVTMREQLSGHPPRYHAAAARSAEPAAALGQAMCEAVLRDDRGSVLVAGARRLVEAGAAVHVAVRPDGAEPFTAGDERLGDAEATSVRVGQCAVEGVAAAGHGARALARWMDALRRAAPEGPR